MKMNTVIIMFVIALSFLGCTNCSTLPERALIEPKQIKKAIELEIELNKREGLAIPTGENWFNIIDGKIPVIITAPHSTRPFREGKYRFSDGGATAALAVALGELTGAYVMYTTYEGPLDPNYYNNSKFKKELETLIKKVKPKYLLDIHVVTHTVHLI